MTRNIIDFCLLFSKKLILDDQGLWWKCNLGGGIYQEETMRSQALRRRDNSPSPLQFNISASVKIARRPRSIDMNPLYHHFIQMRGKQFKKPAPNTWVPTYIMSSVTCSTTHGPAFYFIDSLLLGCSLENGLSFWEAFRCWRRPKTKV